MKKIKITEQQAKMLKELKKKKVLKVTQEQYDLIVGLEQLNETDPISKGFQNNLTREAKKQFNTTRLPESIKEMYKEFINELYNINEDTEKKYENLIKLMEVSGYITKNKIVKEKFNGDKNIVEYAICEGLYEMNNGASHYRAMERIEEALSNDDIINNIRKNINKTPPENPTSKEELEKKLDDLRNRELERREKENSDVKSIREVGD